MARRKREEDSGDEIESGEEDAAPAAASDDDDDGEDEEDDDGGEERTTRKKKKRRTGALNLIDEEAEEDDDLDDEEDDDDLGGVKGLIHDGSDDEGAGGAGRSAGREELRAQRLRREQDMKGEDARDVVRRIEERWAQKSYDDVEDADGEPLDSAGVDQQGLQPTIRDPRVFVLRCRKPGYERRAILTLLQKMFDLKARGVDIGILSAIAPDHLKGFIYIEAHSVSQVEQAIRGLDLITSYGGIKPLLLDEMTDVLQVGKRLDKQEPGNWVRIQRGVYKGDLAQVYKVPEGGADNQVMVRMIPRLRFRREEGDEDEFDDEEDEEYEDVYDDDPSAALGKGVKGKKKIKRRAPQKLFDHRECTRLFSASGDDRSFTTRDQFSGEVFETWDGDLYRLGLLYKKVSLRTLMLNDAVIPTADELEKWAAAETRIRLLAKDPETANMVDARDLREGLLLKEAAAKSKRKTSIFKGDSVNIIQGEQAGMSGTVVGFDGGIVLIEDATTNVAVRASRADVVKTFKVGDHVKVTSGKYAGHAGVLVVVNGDSMVLFTDSTKEEIKVTGQQVSDSNDLAIEEQVSTVANGRQIRLFEMVHPMHDRDAKGVIVGIHGEQVSVLNEANVVNEYPMRDLRHVGKDAYSQAVDARGNKLSRNIALHVISGNLKDRTGIIVEVTGSTVFFKAADEVRNCGILAVPCQYCEAQAAAARTLGAAGGLPTPVPRGSLPTLNGGGGGFLSAGRGGGMRGGRGGGRMVGSRDVLKNRDVKVVKGPYKGHHGKVVDTNEKTIRVELVAKMKVITLARDKVKDVSGLGAEDSNGGSGSGRELSSGSGMNGIGRGTSQPAGGRTPINFGGRTPRGAGSSGYGGLPGMRTPSGAGQFGNMPGSRTPAHHGFGGGLVQPRTPAHNAYLRPATPSADEYGGGFGSFGQPSSADISANPYTPYPPMTPSTPNMQPVTPGGGGYGSAGLDGGASGDAVPQTPGEAGYNMPQTPQMMDPQTPQMDSMEPQTPMPYGEVVSTPGGPTPVTPEPSTPMPHTPGPIDEPSTPAPDGGDGDAAAGAAQQQGYKVLIDVVVSLPDMGGRSAVVTDAAFDGMYVDVRLLDTGENIQLTSRNFTPVQPAIEPGTENLVKVLDGELAGQVGRLKSMETQPDGAAHGQIEFGHGDIRVLDMAIVAKYQLAS